MQTTLFLSKLVAAASSVLVIVGSVGSASAQVDFPVCSEHTGLYVCNRLTDPLLMPGNHSYLWDARTGNSCGMTSSFGSNRSAYEQGPTGDACNFILDSHGLEQPILDFCQENANNGLWLPFINDCHNAVDDSIYNFGLPNPGAPGGRLGDLNNEFGESNLWQPWNPDEYGFDSDGDGIFDSSGWPYPF